MLNSAKMTDFELNLSLNNEENHYFKTIGEVSSELGVPPHVLRFWESKFQDIKPHKRKGGHRYYSQEDVKVIKQVKALLYEEGFTIKGAQKYLREQKRSEEANDMIKQFTETGQHNLFVEQLSEQSRNLANDIEQNNSVDPQKVKILLKELENIKKILQE